MNFGKSSFQPFSSVQLPETPYILDLKYLKNDSGADAVVCVASDFSLGVSEFRNDGSLVYLYSIPFAHEERICPISDSNSNGLSFWTASLDKTLKYWDLRQSPKTPVMSCNARFPLTCISASKVSTGIITGTELVGEDSHLLFWDSRNLSQPVLDYNECHNDDITTVLMHPCNPGICFSAAVDGIICVFDVTEVVEDDALKFVLNCGSSVNQFDIFGPGETYLSCLTHIETMSIWNWSDGSMIKDFGDIRKQTGSDYAISSWFDSADERLYLFSGDQSGGISIHHIGLNEIQLTERLSGAHSDIVRCAKICDISGSNERLFLSGSEDGLMASWKKS